MAANVETFICNKCFATMYRGKTPFSLTQCGHIFCNDCIERAQKQCPQCLQMNIYSVELQEPSQSKVKDFFVPLNEALEQFYKVCVFQNGQMQIMVQRFHDIDKKYEILKSHCYKQLQHIKAIQNKYIKLKMEKSQQQKKLKSIDVYNRTLNSTSDIYAPKSSNDRSSARNTMNPYYSTSNRNMSCETFNTQNKHRIFEDFRVPNIKSSTLRSSRDAANTSSTYTFRH